MISSVGFPQLLGNSVVGHDPLVSINFPLGRSLVASLISRLICCKGDFWWIFLEHPSLPEDVISHGVFLFCAIGV